MAGGIVARSIDIPWQPKNGFKSERVRIMKSLVMYRIFVFALLLAAQASLAAEFSGYVTLTSDYVKRGVTQSDGNPAFQIDADLNFESGFFLGLWSSTIDITNGPSRQRDVEVNYYGGYVFDASNSWQVSVGVVAYRYPGQSGGIDYDYDYDYEEYSLGGNFKDRIWIEVAYSPDLYNTGLSSTNVDLYAEWPINSVWAIGGGAGYFDPSNLTRSAYQYWQLGITGSLRWADIDLRVHDTDRWVPIISTPDRAKSRVVLSVQVPF
jgi:uncharacterized protein (TIGR02001 family)